MLCWVPWRKTLIRKDCRHKTAILQNQHKKTTCGEWPFFIYHSWNNRNRKTDDVHHNHLNQREEVVRANNDSWLVVLIVPKTIQIAQFSGCFVNVPQLLHFLNVVPFGDNARGIYWIISQSSRRLNRQIVRRLIVAFIISVSVFGTLRLKSLDFLINFVWVVRNLPQFDIVHCFLKLILLISFLTSSF